MESPSSTRGRPRGRRKRLLAAGAASVGALALVVSACTSSGAQVGEHWHATLDIEVCGASYQEPPTDGGVHSHGDGLIHLHPQDSSEAGNNASLRTFFKGTRMRLEEDFIQLTGEPEYRDGDRCHDGNAGRLRVLANGEEIADFLSYLPRDGDFVQVLFR